MVPLMPDRNCTQCGLPTPADSRFCSHCGAVQAEPPAPPAPLPGAATIIDTHPPGTADKASQATMFGYSAAALMPAGIPQRAPVAAAAIAPAPILAAQPVVSVGPPAVSVQPSSPSHPASPPQPTNPPQPAFSPAVASGPSNFKGTMIGMSAVAPPVAPAASGPPPAAVPAQPGAAFRGTMLGVARPGIAPLSAGAQGTTSTPPLAGPNRTMLGVALPGIAPTGAAPAPVSVSQPPQFARPAPPIVPKPPPLIDDEPQLGPAPALSRRGVPLAYVAGGVLVLVAVFGLTVGLLWKSHPLIVQPRLDAQGHDQLHLRCENCKDGTVAKLDDASAAFQSNEADLTLASPLKVGDNAVTIHLLRPGSSRGEEVRAVVPIAYRVKADLTGLSGAHPAVVVRIEAQPGTDVRVEDKPVTLDAAGQGSYSIDVSALTSGWSDDLRLIDRAIPYAITPKAAAEQRGTLAVRAGIATLHLDAPGPSLVIDGASFRIAGRTVKGSTVTANGQPVPVDPDGNFARSYDAPSVGDVAVELRADGPQLASRTARFTVKRVAHLADEAKQREAAPWLGHDAVLQDPDGSVGKAAVVEGEMVDSRSNAGVVIALIEDIRGCAAGPCVVRVVYGGDETLGRGDRARVYGHVTRTVAQAGGGKAVPEVQADFVLKGRAHR